MTFRETALRFEKILQDNSPAILTGFAVVGTVATAFLTGKASFKAADVLNEQAHYDEMYNKAPRDTKEQIKLVWKLYIPPVVTGAFTVSCIIVSNRIGTRRAAAMAAAYSVLDKGYTEYKEKVIDKLGEKKEHQVREEIMQDRIRRDPDGSSSIIVTSGNSLFYDAFTDRYWECTMERVKKAQNDINYKVIHNMYASLGDYYEMVGLKPTSASEELGWSTDSMMELDFYAVITDKGEPCICVDFRGVPTRGYSKLS